MARKKSVKIEQSPLPKAIRKVFGAQDKVLIAEDNTKKKVEKSNIAMGEALDSAEYHIFAITDSRENAKFSTFWTRYSVMFSDAMKDEIEKRWNAARAIILAMSSAHKELMDEHPDLYDWGRRKQEIDRHMAWCNPNDNNKGNAAKARASKCETSGGVSKAKLASAFKPKNKKVAERTLKSTKADMGALSKALTSLKADYVSLNEYLKSESIGTEKQRENVNATIDKVIEAIAKLEGKI